MTALDLFCGGGGAARGLMAAGVTRIVGIDCRPRDADAYPGVFIRHDLREGLPHGIDPRDFDIVWASPPCQLFSKANTKANPKALNLIPETREMICGHPRGIIENVPGACRKAGLRRDLTLTGPMVGLNDICRERVFELTGMEHHWRMLPPQTVMRRPAGGWSRKEAWRAGSPISVLTNSGGVSQQQARRARGLPMRIPVELMRRCMGIPAGEMTRRQIGNAVPPAYAKRVSEVVLEAWPVGGVSMCCRRTER